MNKLTVNEMKQARGGLPGCQFFEWDNMDCFVCNGTCFYCSDGSHEEFNCPQ